MGLANNPTEFSEEDATVAKGFADYAAVSLSKSFKDTAIEESNAKLSILIEKLGVVGS